MSSLRSEIVRLAYAKPHLRGALLPVLVRLAKEFNTDKELEAYLEAHPDADKSLHSVKKPEDGKAKPAESAKPEKADAAVAAIRSKSDPAVSKALGTADASSLPNLAQASPEAKANVADAKKRNESMQNAAKNMKENRDAAIVQITEAAKKAGVDLEAAEAAFKKARSGKELTNEELQSVAKAAAFISEQFVDVASADEEGDGEDDGDGEGGKGGGHKVDKDTKPGFLRKLFDFLLEELSKLDGLQNLRAVLAETFKFTQVDKPAEDKDKSKKTPKSKKPSESKKPPESKKAPESKKPPESEDEIPDVTDALEEVKAPKTKSKPAPNKAEATAKIEAAKKQYSLTPEEIYSMRTYASSTWVESQTKKTEKTDAQLMQEFLAKASPETKKRLRGMSPAAFKKILGAMLDEEEADAAMGKTAKVQPGVTFAADIYDRMVGLFEKGISEKDMADIIKGVGKKATLRAATIRLAYEKPHLRGLLLPLVTR